MLCSIKLSYNFRVKIPFAPHSGGPRSAYGHMISYQSLFSCRSLLLLSTIVLNDSYLNVLSLNSIQDANATTLIYNLCNGTNTDGICANPISTISPTCLASLNSSDTSVCTGRCEEQFIAVTACNNVSMVLLSV